MVAEPARYETVAFPALLRQAPRPYARATMTALAQAGCDDMPQRQLCARGQRPRRRPAQPDHPGSGVSKQAAGQLIDTLVSRGYLDRSVDPRDRRRLTISLTERGAAAAAVIGAAVARSMPGSWPGSAPSRWAHPRGPVRPDRPGRQRRRRQSRPCLTRPRRPGTAGRRGNGREQPG